MARIEHYDDPEAPEPNSLVSAASAAVSNENNEILMQRRVDNDLWALPGGPWISVKASVRQRCVRRARKLA